MSIARNNISQDINLRKLRGQKFEYFCLSLADNLINWKDNHFFAPRVFWKLRGGADLAEEDACLESELEALVC